MTTRAQRALAPGVAVYEPEITGPQVFLLIVTAIPAAGGASEPLFLFARARSVRTAVRSAVTALAERGWRQVELQGAQAIGDNDGDDFVREAAAKAAATGFAMIRYGA